MRFLIIEPEGFSEKAENLLSDAGHEIVRFGGSLPLQPADLEGTDGAIIRLGFHWTSDFLKGCPASFKYLVTPTTGLDHIDLPTCKKRGIEVISLRGRPGLDQITSTPEHAMGLLLALIRHIPQAYQSVMEGQWDRDRFYGIQLSGRCLGLIGLGRTGKHFAKLAEAFGMKILYYDPYVDDARWEKTDSLETLAEQSEVIALHAVHNKETHQMIDASFFKACKNNPYIVNTARGELMDEEALLSALESNTVAGAALDVLDCEPTPQEPISPQLLGYARQNNNLILTPHIAGASFDAMRQTECMICTALLEKLA